MDYSKLLHESKEEILQGIQHLEYSYSKVKKLGADPELLTSEDLESWEGLIARFGRVSDIFLSKYLRTQILLKEPGFRGSFRDLLDLSEKYGLVKSADFWAEIRELRNSSVHEYSKTKVPFIFSKVRELTPHLIALKESLG